MVLILITFWLLFFRRFFENPYHYATGEHVSNYFPYWRWMGQQIRKGKGWFKDDNYYFNSGGIPFLGAWYPPNMFLAFVGNFLSVDRSFILYTFSLFVHYLAGSIFAFALFSQWADPWIALIATLSLTYGMKGINLNGALTFTWNWIPVILYFLSQGNSLVAGLCTVMMFSAGYTTMLVYTFPLFLFFAFRDCNVFIYTLPLVLCVPQLLHTFRHMRKTVRTKTSYEQRAIGSVPPWHFISFLIPLRFNMNGVNWHEMSYGIGRIGFLMACFCTEWRLWALLGLGLYLMLGKYIKAPVVLRVPVKWSYITTIALAYMISLFPDILPTKALIILFLLHAWDILIQHSPLLTANCEGPKKPSEAFNTELTTYLDEHLGTARVSGLPFPLYCGYINGYKTLGYTGGSCLSDMAKFFKFDSNGSPYHDWFDFRDDDKFATDYGVRFAYTKHKVNPVNWKKTQIKHLYINEDVPKDWSTDWSIQEQLEWLTRHSS